MWWMVAISWALQSTRDPEALCELADAVVVAEITSAETFWSTGPEGDLVTRTWAAVSQVVRGPVGDTVELLSRGGSHDGVVQWVEDEASLRNDHRYVLLLTRDGNAWRVTGGEAGAWPLAHGASPVVPEACHAPR